MNYLWVQLYTFGKTLHSFPTLEYITSLFCACVEENGENPFSFKSFLTQQETKV